jgi:hypothetical protein
MRNLSIVAIMLFGINCFGQTSQFEKPRYLKYATLLCPIDITKSYGKDGLIGGNDSITLKINIDSIMVKVMVDVDNKKVEMYTKKAVKDTILIKTILIEKGNAFDIVQQIGSFCVIKFWDLSESHAKGLIKKLKSHKNKEALESNELELELEKSFEKIKIEGLTAMIDGKDYDLSKTYYLVPTKTLINNSTEFENKNGLWSIGLLVLPIKVRPFATENGQFDFSNGFSVGTTFSWTVHHNWQTNFTHSFLIYAGISSYKADESKIKEFREDYTIATFSPALGWMWEKNNVQLGLLMGIDFPAGNLQQNWVYRNQPWFGLGVGIALFKINNEEQTKSGEN